MSKVVILGGGVGGLSAAHHLIENGAFDVEIYERQNIPGGKARSYYFYGRGGNRLPEPGYPAEHGFRFFPGFYRHVTDTMDNIQAFDNDGKVFDNLVPATEMSLARYDFDQLKLPARFPQTRKGFEMLIKVYLDSNIPIPVDELEFWQERVWQILTSCRDRRATEYEKLSWWEFIKAGSSSTVYQKYLANLTRTLVAAVPQKASTKTNGDILIQLLMSMWNFGTGVDRVLNGPTNEVWINPWLQQLLDRGVKYYINAEAKFVHCSSTKITGITISKTSEKIKRVTSIDRYGKMTTETVDASEVGAVGDYYVSAVPVEKMTELLWDGNKWTDLAKLDTRLKKIKKLSESKEWMNGILFYLTYDPKIIHGHTIYVDAPWALTSISQPQFWKHVDVSKYGDGKIKGIISVDISDWMVGEAEVNGEMKTAICCSPPQIRDVVWRDLKASLNHDDANPVLTDYHDWFLDADITQKLELLTRVRREARASFEEAMSIDERVSRIESRPPFRWTTEDLPEGDEHILENKEPLLVNEINTWKLRPEAVTDIPNLFLASDYVRTYTDLATMEGANEAARRAVNGILEASLINARCNIWSLQEPRGLLLFRKYDQHRYNKGLDWDGTLPFPIRIVDRIWGIMSKFVRKAKAVHETAVGQEYTHRSDS